MTTRIETRTKTTVEYRLNQLYDQLPWQQGLKLVGYNTTLYTSLALWPTSMTTRIETIAEPVPVWFFVSSLWPTSMTTRIETYDSGFIRIQGVDLYDQLPWQQGLKLLLFQMLRSYYWLYDQLPWQQGLKRYRKIKRYKRYTKLYDQLPWQQGLKPISLASLHFMFTLYDQLPWQQGLKLNITSSAASMSPNSLWPTSMTTRIETFHLTVLSRLKRPLWPTSMTTRIETRISMGTIVVPPPLYDQLPWQQGLKPPVCEYLLRQGQPLWPTSMTTRIETWWVVPYQSTDRALWPTSMTTRIETRKTEI